MSDSRLRDIAALVEADQSIQPEGRRLALAATLREQAEFTERHCACFGIPLPDPNEMLMAFSELSRPKPDDDPATTSRRATLRAVASAINDQFGFDYRNSAMPEDPTGAGAIPWFAATVSELLESFDSDPRHAAMVERAAIEAAELGDDFLRAVVAVRKSPPWRTQPFATETIQHAMTVRTDRCLIFAVREYDAKGERGTAYPTDAIAPDQPVKGIAFYVRDGIPEVKQISPLHNRAEVVSMLERAGVLFGDSLFRVVRSGGIHDDPSVPLEFRPRFAAQLRLYAEMEKRGVEAAD